MTVVPAEEIACSAVDTLLALMRHRTTCKQCPLDEDFCDTARVYQREFMRDVQRYKRAKEAAR